MGTPMTKTDRCPGCCPEGGAFFRRDFEFLENEDGEVDLSAFEPHWVCQNCGWKKRIHTRTAWRGGQDLPNKAQQRTLEGLRRELGYMDRQFPGEYEFKRWEVEETDYGYIWLTSEYGRVGDEGTLASVFARTSRHIQIGPRGGTRDHSR